MSIQPKTNALEIHKLLTELRDVSIAGFGQLDDFIGYDIFPTYLGRMLSLTVEGENTDGQKHEDLIAEIPTETTTGERRFLFNFFKEVWSGNYSVLEIGPFLGGSTRAMALGMEANPNKLERAKLFTFDKFSDYYNPERLGNVLKPLLENGSLNGLTRDEILQSSQFLNVFKTLHKNYSYSKFVQPIEGQLPNTPEETTLGNIFRLQPGMIFEAVFVDGCKSWYGTKYFMKELADSLQQDSYFIFQDYGANTCFWIPCFVALMPDFFKLVAHVDSTYTFRLLKPLSPPAIEAHFPDSPEAFGRINFDLLFYELIKNAGNRSDIKSVLNYKLQHAASLAYLGYYDDARQEIVDLLKLPEYKKYRDWIVGALNVPTYRPEGNIYL